jgi:uncharacterized protein
MKASDSQFIIAKEVFIIENHSSRLSGIDGIRGLSLLGILLANMLAFQYSIWEFEIIPFFQLSKLDQLVYSLLNIIIVGSFAPIFAFLYGFGTVKMTEGLEQRGLAPSPFLIRRFLFLLAAGLLHFGLLWEGDILATYGIAGFLLLPLLKAKPKSLIIGGICVLIMFSLLSFGTTGDQGSINDRWFSFAETSLHTYQSGSYADIQSFRFLFGPEPFGFVIFAVSWLLIPFLISSMFMFGMAAARLKLLHHPEQERSLYKRWIAIFIPIGLVLKTFAVMQPNLGISGSLQTFGGTVLALGYIFAFALMFSIQSQRVAGWQKRLISVGRLSMSNYLLQTIFGVFIFYGYGLGLFGKLGTTFGCLLAIGFFALQAWASGLYLRKFSNGPAEKLLRSWVWLGQRRKQDKSSTHSM